MSQSANNQQEWLKVLGKGMVTLPKKWRDDLGIETGDVVKAKKEGNMVIIESGKTGNVPYRIYSKSEIEEFIKEDELEPELAEKVLQKLSKSD